MKYTFLCITTVIASLQSLILDADFSSPASLGRRMIRNKGGKVQMKVKIDVPPPGPGRPDSPAKKGDAKVMAKTVGPGSAATKRAKNKDLENPVDKILLEKGQQGIKETHDARWSKAEAKTDGRPPSGASKQSHLLHPAKVEGSGRNVFVEVKAPRGGYGHITKEVDGQVVQKERVNAGDLGVGVHHGTRPDEAKFKASVSRGGEAFLNADNLGRNSRR